MTAFLLLLLGTGVGAGTLATLLTQAAIHHHQEITGVSAAVLLWLAHRVHRFFANPGRRVMSPEAKAALKAQRAAGRHETPKEVAA